MTATEPDASHGYPQPAATTGRVEPAPRRVRGMLGHEVVFDTTAALYVWEWAYYPQYYIPLQDVAQQYLRDTGQEKTLSAGAGREQNLVVGQVTREHAAAVLGAGAAGGLADHVRFEWGALDAWFEEDEQVWVHPRNPYVRVDPLRSHRHVRVELDGVVLAETRSPVLVFETGLPTRYYLDPTDVRFAHLERTGTETACPYKGVTSDYWSVMTPTGVHADLAWSYRSTTDALRAISGMVAFYDEKVDVMVDGQRQPRPVTHF